jgi:hypothetical protein
MSGIGGASALISLDLPLFLLFEPGRSADLSALAKGFVETSHL